MRTLFIAALIVGSAALTGVPAKAQGVDADITIGTSRDRYDDDDFQRRDRGYHRGWREERPRGYTVRRTIRPSYGIESECRTVIKKIWRHGERVTIRRRICDD